MKFAEKFLYEIWKEKNFIADLFTSDGEQFEILETGIENNNLQGPDFLNAKIKIGNITFNGDVEIDTLYSDWQNHGHFLDKKYNKVILHIVLSREHHKPIIKTRDGRTVPSLCMQDFLDESFRDAVQKSIKAEQVNRNFKLPCSEWNDSLTDNFKIGVLFDFGIKRFSKKCRAILHRVKELIYLKEMNIREPVVKYDFGEDFINKKFTAEDFSDKESWNQILYELIFEALGYSNNKEVMLKLAKSVNIKFINDFSGKENFLEIIESSLFSVSGLLPSGTSFKNEETAEYVRIIIETWQQVKNKYDAPLLSSEHWNFFKLRPTNFPPVRIAGGARILYSIVKENLFKKLIEIITEEQHPRTTAYNIHKAIAVQAEGYWAKHYVFDKEMNESIKYFVGTQRVDDIIVNVVFPLYTIYFEIFSDTLLSKKVKRLYSQFYQESSSKLVNEITQELGVKKLASKSIVYQGAIDLFRNYCTLGKCLECKIGEKIFN